MFFIFCDLGIACGVVALLISIITDICDMKKKRIHKRRATFISNIIGYGFALCTLLSSVCLFAGI